ncbi:MAG TPA: TIR domain-containing protein [Anaerolineales bacterium]|nr:TIR domain-containing protein [Anaerolineales bacterium]
MNAPLGPYFFVSYSRADTTQQHKIVAELRGRGVNVWVDTENLVPGSPAWEREIERSIRNAAGIIVLLSPAANNSEWVRREISFTEENDKRIFPVLIHGDENDSIPLRLSSHQRVDLRRNFTQGLDQLADALKDHLGVTAVGKKIKIESKKSPTLPPLGDMKKYAIPLGLVVMGIFCISLTVFAIRRFASVELTATPTNVPIEIEITRTPTDAKPVDNYPDPIGKIIYTCQVGGDEVCVMNPDGKGQKQLTDSPLASFNASLSPDGKKAVFITIDSKISEIYELDIDTGKTKQLTDLKKNLGSPEISPDNQNIIFHYRSGNDNLQLWIMNRDGSEPREFYKSPGRDAHDPTWSPDGTRILFAEGRGDNNKLYIMDSTGHESKLVNDSIDTRGRSDWSINDLISFDQGGPFKHEVYVMSIDGDNLLQLSNGNNSQGASLSPDGKWIAFTGYTNVADQDLASCEIFIMRTDGTDIRQLTHNNYCDYQPRWGN